MLDGVELAAQRRFCRLRQRGIGFVRFVLPLPLHERPVVGKARHTAGFLEVGRLRVIGIKSNSVGHQHDCDSSTAFFTPSMSFWFLRLREPYSRAENTVMSSSTSLAKSSSNVVSSPWLRMTTSTFFASQMDSDAARPLCAHRETAALRAPSGARSADRRPGNWPPLEG